MPHFDPSSAPLPANRLDSPPAEAFDRPVSAEWQAERFRQLQARLPERNLGPNGFDGQDCDILVVPSLSLDQEEADKIAGIHHYEERLLFSLIQLRNPHTRLIYVTSQPLPDLTIQYYLQLLPGIPFSHARDRLLLLSAHDGSRKSLTRKILERPRLMARIRRALSPDRSYMTCFNATELERELSVKLNVPLWAPDPDLRRWGTKSGSRAIFAECGIPHPDGSGSLWSADDLAAGTADLWGRNPDLQRVAIKLNEGFSGQGNAILDLRPLADLAPGRGPSRDRERAIRKAFETMAFQAAAETWDGFSRRIPELGAIAEAFVEGEGKRSPSVQCCILPDGTVEVLSTHDQILGGADGQVFLGCSFPAAPDYRLPLQAFGRRVGANLAAKGCLERFGVDFLAVPRGAELWDLQAIEINLRKGGTTHPFATLRYLTNGTYDLQDGLFRSRSGQPKYYLASDNLKGDRYRGLLPNDLMDIIAHHRLHFDTSTETGTVFHLMGSLSEFGKLGLTSIGDSPEEAQIVYDRVVSALDAETEPAPGDPEDCASAADFLPPVTWPADSARA